MQPVTQYAKSGDVHIAYQSFGGGPINLVMVPGFVSNVENYWDEPDLARFLNRLGSYARVVTFDKRGTGMSDRGAELPGLDLIAPPVAPGVLLDERLQEELGRDPVDVGEGLPDVREQLHPVGNVVDGPGENDRGSPRARWPVAPGLIGDRQ